MKVKPFYRILILFTAVVLCIASLSLCHECHGEHECPICFFIGNIGSALICLCVYSTAVLCRRSRTGESDSSFGHTSPTLVSLSVKLSD